MSARTALRVLFVCTGNAGRSQMAHALFAGQCDSHMQVDSAGVDPWPALHPLALALMADRGISMDGHHPKGVDAVGLDAIDVVVTIGDRACAEIPRGPISAAHWIHWDIADPADADGTPAAEMTFRATLQAIESQLPQLSQYLTRVTPVAAVARTPGISTGLWGDVRFKPSVHLPLLQRAGFQAIELNLYQGEEHFDWRSPEAVRELRRVADDLGVCIWSVHAPDLASVASPEATQRQIQTDAIERCVDLAMELGARVVVSHALLLGPFREDPDGCERRIDSFLDHVQAMVEHVPLRVGFENDSFPASAAVGTERVLARLSERSPAACGFVLDSGHAQLENSWKVLREGMGGHLISVHLNDNDSVGDTHLAPMNGVINWDMVRELVAHSGYRGPAMYELASQRDASTQLELTMKAHQRLFGAAV